MTRFGALVVRRFASKVNGHESVIEVRQAVELAVCPSHGMVLAFADGTGDCTVSRVRHRVGPGPSLGLLPVEIELIGCKEPFAGLEAALAAGWQREEAPTVAAQAFAAACREVPT